MMGILLGAIREKDFIKWDWDVELAVFSEIAIKELDKIKAKSTDSGFEAKIIDSSIGNLKINLHKYDTKYTIVGLYKKKEYRLRKSFKYPAKFFDNATSIHFLGKNYLTPAPTNEFLTFIYGVDWQVPKMASIKEEYLSKEVWNEKFDKDEYIFPDTLVGTDSHTTMVNGLSVLGWGVGGIEAEAGMLGQPISMLIPEVIGFELIIFYKYKINVKFYYIIL